LSGRVTPMPSIPYTWNQPAKSLEPPQCTHKLNTAVCQRLPISSLRPPASISLPLRFFVKLPCIRLCLARYDIVYPYLGNHVSTSQLSHDISNFYGNHNCAEFLSDDSMDSLLKRHCEHYIYIICRKELKS